MTVSQPVTTLSETASQIRVISDAIFNVDPMVTPVVARLGLNSANSKFQLTGITRGKNHVKIELLEDSYAPISTTANHNTTITTSTLSWTVTNGGIFQAGQKWLIDSEYVVVASVASNVVTWDSRAYGGTNATHAAGATMTLVGMARKEGADASFPDLTSLVNPYNYTNIYEKGVKVTGTEMAMTQYGKPAGEYRYQLNKVIPELTRLMEMDFFHSQRRQATSSLSRSMGGVGTYVTTAPSGASITTTLTKAAINAAAKYLFDNGGKPDLLVLGSGAAQSLYTLMDSSNFVRITQENTMFGMRPITRVNTQFFENLEVLVSRFCPAKTAYVLDSSKIGFYEYRPFFENPVSSNGDYKPTEVIGEYSLLVANGTYGHCKITTSGSTL